MNTLYSRIILCMRPASERRCYIVTSSLIGWVHTQNDPCTPMTQFDLLCFVVNVWSGLRGFRKVWKFPVESMYLSDRNVPMDQVVIMWLTWGTAADIPHVDDNVSLIFKDYKLNFADKIYHYLKWPFVYCEIPLNYTGWHLLDYRGSFTSAHPYMMTALRMLNWSPPG